MDRNDSQAIEGLFGKLAQVERQASPRDAESDAFIREKIAQQPGAPYYMAQTIIVQEQALNAAQARIEELEAQSSRQGSSGGLFGSLFGGGSSAPARAAPARGGYDAPQAGGPWQRGAAGGGMGGGGGFLAGAAQTAMGVAGGVLLGNAIAGMFGGDEAVAAEQDAGGADAAGAEDAGGEATDAGFDGGDMGDFEL